MIAIDEILNILSIDLLGIVIDDQDVIIGANQGEPVALNPSTKSGMAYRNIARRVLGESVPLMEIGERRSFLNKVRQILLGAR